MSKIPRRARPALLTAAFLLAGSSLAVVPAVAQDEPQFDGVQINLVTFSGPPIYEPLQRHALAWQELDGRHQVNITTYPFSDLYQSSPHGRATGTNSFDVMTLARGGWATSRAAATSTTCATRIPTQPADRVGRRDAVLPRLVGLVRRQALWRRHRRRLPDGLLPHRHPRRGRRRQPPKTWDEYLAHRRAVRRPGPQRRRRGGLRLLHPKARGGVGTWHFNGVLAPFIQTQGTTQGTFFGDNMEPLVNNAAMSAALDFWQKAGEFGPPDEINLDQAGRADMFVSGRCAVNIDWGDTGVLAIDPATVHRHRQGGTPCPCPAPPRSSTAPPATLVACDATTCPNADRRHERRAVRRIRRLGGRHQLAHLADASRTRPSTSSRYVCAPEQSNKDVTVGITGMNPYRLSQLDTATSASGSSPASARRRRRRISKPSARASRARTWCSTCASGRRTTTRTCWRTPAIAQFLAGELTKEQAMQQIYDAWQALTDQIGRDASRLRPGPRALVSSASSLDVGR